MSFKVEGVNNLAGASPKKRFARPASNARFKWYKFPPGPAYVMCVVKITNIISSDQIECVFLNPHTGTEFTAAEIPATTLTISDRNHFWRNLPSTIDLPNTAADDHATLFITEEWLDTNAKPLLQVFTQDPSLKAKYPPGEDGLLTETVKELTKALRALGKDPNSSPSEFPKFQDLQKQLPDIES